MQATPPIEAINRRPANVAKLGAKHAPIPNKLIHIPRKNTDFLRPNLRDSIWNSYCSKHDRNKMLTYQEVDQEGRHHKGPRAW